MTIEFNLLILLILTIFSSVISITCCILAGIAIKYSMQSHVAVLAMEKSTHTVQYMPIDPQIDKENQEWATKQENLDKDRKMFRDEIKNEMPEFAADDEDSKIYSF